MLPSVYQRFVEGAGMAVLHDNARRTYQKETFMPNIQAEYDESIETVLLEEVAMDIGEQDTDHWDGITIFTDARHDWRKNAKDTSVVVIGDKTHSVLQHVHVTKNTEA